MSREALGNPMGPWGARHAVAAAASALLLNAAVAAGQSTRASVATDGAQANGPSDSPAVSADGRFVTFSSAATNLVSNDTNGSTDVFVRDRVASSTTRVSVDSAGLERTGHSLTPHISANGRFVVFVSAAPLVASDTNTCQPPPAAPTCHDIYVHDRDTGTTSRVSVSSQGTQANAGSFDPHISGDGRFVVFGSDASNLVPDDTNGNRDVFLHDRQTGTTTLLLGVPPIPNRFGEPEPTISDDGSTIAFSVWVPPAALPLTTDGTPPDCWHGDACPATMVYTRATGTYDLVSPRLPGVTGQNLFFADEPAQVSGDGRVLVIKQVMLIPNTNPLQSDARFLVYDRLTGGTSTGPWRSSGLPADIVGLGGDARYLALIGGLPGGEHQRIFRDRVAALDETFEIAASPGSENDPTGMALSADGRFAAFVSRSMLIGADTNAVADVYVLDRDADGDGLPSVWETRFGLSPTDPTNATADPDGDGLSSLQEYTQGSHPDKGVTRYLAEGAANLFMTTRLAVVNPQNTTVEAAFRLLGSTGNRKTLLRSLAPRSRTTIVLGANGEAPENDFATVVESTHPIVIDRTMTWDARGYGAHAETSVAAPATTWYLAEGATGGPFNLFYLLVNATALDATVTVRYLRPTPLPPIVKTYLVPGSSRRTIWVDVEDPQLANSDLSATIVSDRPIVVERAQYASTTDEPFTAGHDGAGIVAPALSWFLAEGATGPFFDLYVLIANPGTTDAQISVKYLLPDGQSFTKTYGVARESRHTIWVDHEDSRLANTPVGMVVTSTNGQPVVVERAMWWPDGSWYEAHLAAGATTTGTAWALADGEIQSIAGEDSKETFVLIANTGSTAGSATVTLLVEGATPVTFTAELQGDSRVTVPTSGFFPLGSHASFGVIVESSGIPIVVERAMYTTVDGVLWSAGTAAIATKLQ